MLIFPFARTPLPSPSFDPASLSPYWWSQFDPGTNWVANNKLYDLGSSGSYWYTSTTSSNAKRNSINGYCAHPFNGASYAQFQTSGSFLSDGTTDYTLLFLAKILTYLDDAGSLLTTSHRDSKGVDFATDGIFIAHAADDIFFSFTPTSGAVVSAPITKNVYQVFGCRLNSTTMEMVPFSGITDQTGDIMVANSGQTNNPTLSATEDEKKNLYARGCRMDMREFWCWKSRLSDTNLFTNMIQGYINSKYGTSF